jgi:hypothetical protein
MRLFDEHFGVLVGETFLVVSKVNQNDRLQTIQTSLKKKYQGRRLTGRQNKAPTVPHIAPLSRKGTMLYTLSVNWYMFSIIFNLMPIRLILQGSIRKCAYESY